MSEDSKTRQADLRCTFCGADLWVYENEDGVRSIECNSAHRVGGCNASWTENGAYIGGGNSGASPYTEQETSK